jgi:hypothetical protein
MHISLYLSKKLSVIAEKGSLPAAFPFYQTTEKKADSHDCPQMFRQL